MDQGAGPLIGTETAASAVHERLEGGAAGAAGDVAVLMVRTENPQPEPRVPVVDERGALRIRGALHEPGCETQTPALERGPRPEGRGRDPRLEDAEELEEAQEAGARRRCDELRTEQHHDPTLQRVNVPGVGAGGRHVEVDDERQTKLWRRHLLMAVLEELQRGQGEDPEADRGAGVTRGDGTGQIRRAEQGEGLLGTKPRVGPGAVDEGLGIIETATGTVARVGGVVEEESNRLGWGVDGGIATENGRERDRDAVAEIDENQRLDRAAAHDVQAVDDHLGIDRDANHGGPVGRIGHAVDEVEKMIEAEDADRLVLEAPWHAPAPR